MANANIKHYLGTGPVSSRPADPDLPPGVSGYWLDGGSLSAWNGSAWVDIVSAAGARTIITPVSGTATLNASSGAAKNFTLTLAVNTTLVVSNPAASGFVTEFEIEIKQPAAGGLTLTLPSSFKPLGGSDTVIAATANAVTVLSAKSFDGGTTYRYAMQESGT